MFLKSKKKNLSDQKPPPEAAVRLDRTLRIWTMTWKQSLHCSGHDLVFGRPPWPRHGRHICLYFTSKHKDPSAFPLLNEANVLFTWTEAIISLFWFLCVLSSKVKAVYFFLLQSYLDAWFLVWSRWQSDSSCPSPPETPAHGSPDRSLLWHRPWSCPGWRPDRPAALVHHCTRTRSLLYAAVLSVVLVHNKYCLQTGSW